MNERERLAAPHSATNSGAGDFHCQSAKQQRMRQSANGIGNSENKALAKCHEQLTIHGLAYRGHHACSQPSTGAPEQPVADRYGLFDESVTVAINEKQYQECEG